MKYLLDTCVLIWAIQGDRAQLGSLASKIEDTSIPAFASIISYWEIIIKQALNKITVPDNFIQLVEKSGFKWLSLELHHLEALKQLPLYHHDPFDRLIVSQTIADKFELLTTDKLVLKYLSAP